MTHIVPFFDSMCKRFDREIEEDILSFIKMQPIVLDKGNFRRESEGALMKIYGDYTFILDRLNIRNNSQVEVFQNGTKIVEFADQFLEEQRAASPDRVSISPEGMGYIRDRLADLSAEAAGPQFPEDSGIVKITGDGLSLMDGVCREYILKRLDFNGENGVSSKFYGEMEKRYLDALAGKEEKSVKDYADSLAKAYGSMYKNILDGYDNGTREVWTLDTSAGEDFNGVEFVIDGNVVRYRKMTKEEELGRLRESFDQLVEDVSRQLAAKEEAAAGNEETAQEEGELRRAGELMAAEEFWKTADVVKDLLKELDILISQIEDMFAKKEPEPENIGERIAAEAKNHVEATVVRGKQQAQFANYRKISQMSMNIQSVLGNLRA